MKKYILIAVSIIFFGCANEQMIHIYSPDKSQCITLVEKGDIRYIINGKYLKIPKKDYIKLDVSNTDYVGDCIHICWGNSKYLWDIVVDNSVIIETKLNPEKFNFNNELPKDAKGIPNEKKFREDFCSIFSFYEMNFSPNKGNSTFEIIN